MGKKGFRGEGWVRKSLKKKKNVHCFSHAAIDGIK
jgi:hypothetical protein